MNKNILTTLFTIIFIIIFIIILIILIQSCKDINTKDNVNKINEKKLDTIKNDHITYTCPMHPEIKQDKPGDCPICGMKLVPINPNNNTKTNKNTDINTKDNSDTTNSSKEHHPTDLFTTQTQPSLHEHSHNIINNKSTNNLSFDNTIKINYDIKLYKLKYLTLKNELKFNGYTSINESNKKSLSLNTDVWIKDTYNLFEGKYIKKETQF